MTLPAARLGDPTNHGGVVVVGFPTVLIGNKPASRIGDMHTCPMFTGPVPHVGGPLVLGAFTVLVGGCPQSRQTDMCICVGPPDAVAMGEPTVHVGLAGSPGALGMIGAIAGGLLRAVKPKYPRTVLQPDGTMVTFYNKAITVEGDAEFQAKAIRDLDKIKETKSGKKLLDSITKSGKDLRIHSDGGTGNWAWTDPPPTATNTDGYMSGGKRGKAADAEVAYNPDRDRLTGPPGSVYNGQAWAQPPNRPPEVGLYHELVHADDFMHGRFDSTNGSNTGAMAGTPIANGELRAVGLPPYQNEAYSENAYRKDRGLAQRTFY